MLSIPYQNITVPAANTISNATVGTTETAFGMSAIIPTTEIAPRKVWRLSGRGYYSTALITLSSITIKIKMGNVVLGSATIVAPIVNVTNLAMKFAMNIICLTLGANGTFEAQGDISLVDATNGIKLAGLVNIAPLVIDTTVDQTLTITATFGNVLGTSTITLRTLLLEQLI